MLGCLECCFAIIFDGCICCSSDYVEICPHHSQLSVQADGSLPCVGAVEVGCIGWPTWNDSLEVVRRWSGADDGDRGFVVGGWWLFRDKAVTCGTLGIILFLRNYGIGHLSVTAFSACLYIIV